MDINEVKEIIKMIDTSSIGELKIETSDFKMELKRPSPSTGNQGNTQNNNEKNKNSENGSKDENSNNESGDEKSADEGNKKTEGNIKNKDEEKRGSDDEKRNSGDSRRESHDERRSYDIERADRRDQSYDRYPETQRNVINNIHVIKSPIVGTYYASPTPYEPPLVKVGSHIRKGDVLCIVEAMKLMNEIKSDVDGEVAEVHVKNEKLVEYGQPLFTIRV